VSSSAYIRSDFLRDLVKTAVKQDFLFDPGGKHPVLVCPVCGHRETITATGKQKFHESRNKAARLRRHGLIWQGRGGKHVGEAV
jgi:hypothetical protein